MQKLKILHEEEGFLSEQYAHPAFLPPLWRVIFQEAMRGHHIIFPRAILELMQDHSEFGKVAKTTNRTLEDFCVHLFAAPDLNTIRNLIHFLPIVEQKQLFVIYVHMMKSIREMNKQESN